MNKKNITIVALIFLVVVGAISLIVRNFGRKDIAKNNIPKDNVTINKMTKEQADFAREFAEKVKTD